MDILYVTISIGLITLLAWGFRRATALNVCPICIGVSATWLIILALMIYGYTIDPILPAILMGGSVVGIAYTTDKKYIDHQYSIIWKVTIIPVGFIAAVGVLRSSWLSVISMLVISMVLYMFMTKIKMSKNEIAQVSELKEELEDCC